MTDLTKPPKKPICKEADSTAPCRYSGSCPASRQLIQGGWKKTAGLWVQSKSEEMRGEHCWAFGMIQAKPGYGGLSAVSDSPKGEVSSPDTIGATDSLPSTQAAA